MDALTEALRRKRRSEGIDWDTYGKEVDPSAVHLTDPMHRVLTAAFVDTVRDWDRDAHILDVGCGDGFWLEILRNLGFNTVVGIDCSMPLLERAAAKGLDVRHGDLYDLDVIDEFDYVVFCDTLEHLPDPARALQRAHRALRTHATLFVLAPVYESVHCRWRRVWHRVERKDQAKEEDPTHLQAFSTGDLMRLLDECYYSVDHVSHVGNIISKRRGPVRWTRSGRHGKWLAVLATSLFHVGWETLEAAPASAQPTDADAPASTEPADSVTAEEAPESSPGPPKEAPSTEEPEAQPEPSADPQPDPHEGDDESVAADEVDIETNAEAAVVKTT